MPHTHIRPMLPSDWPAVRDIYAQGIATGHATFEEAPPTEAAFFGGKLDVGLNVAERDGVVVGWTALSPVSSRQVYSGVAEHSVYVDPAAQGTGTGRALMATLIKQADLAGLWTLQSSVFSENSASLALHDALGFRRIGYRERIALMTFGPAAGTWRDTILLERRGRWNGLGN